MARSFNHEARNRDKKKLKQGLLDVEADAWAPETSVRETCEEPLRLDRIPKPDVVRLSAANRILKHAADGSRSNLHIERPIRAEIDKRFGGDQYAWARAIARLWQRLYGQTKDQE
jgi:hypothetical protein